MAIKNIILRVDEKTHKKLWNQKEALAIFQGSNMSWEDFIVGAKNKKV